MVALAALVFGVAGVGKYGVTGDAPSLFWAGDRTLFYLGHGSVPDAMNYNGAEPAAFHSIYDREQSVHNDPLWCPVMPALVAAITSHVLHDWLGWLNVVDGHHMGLVLLHVLGLLLFGLYATRLLGLGPGLSAMIALALFPSALGHSFNNPKDWPCALFYGVAVLAAGVGVLEGRGWPLLASGLYAGVSLSGKANGVFVFATLLLWAPWAYWLLYRARGRKPEWTVAAAGLGSLYVAIAVFVLLWPWLWYDTLANNWSHLSDYVRFVIDRGSGGRKTWTVYPFVCLAVTTPLLVLGSGAIGLCVGWRGDRARRAVWLLLVVWLVLPLVRIAAPRSNFYDANRHFIEYVPALCCLAGIGFWMTVGAVRRLCADVATRRQLDPAKTRALTVGATVALMAAGVVGVVSPVVGSHPWETAYFNSLVGGLGGAQRSHPLYQPPPHDPWAVSSECDFWWSSLRKGMAMIRSLSGPNPIGVIGICGNTDRLARSNWISPQPVPTILGSIDGWDQGIKDVDNSDYIYVMPREFFCSADRIRALESRHPLLYRESRGGGLIFEILGAAKRGAP